MTSCDEVLEAHQKSIIELGIRIDEVLEAHQKAIIELGERLSEKASVRDQFAMAALTGLLTSPEILGCTPKKTASDAYAMADAMIEARATLDAKGEG